MAAGGVGGGAVREDLVPKSKAPAENQPRRLRSGRQQRPGLGSESTPTDVRLAHAGAEDGGRRGGKHEGKEASSHLPMATIFGSSSQWERR